MVCSDAGVDILLVIEELPASFSCCSFSNSPLAIFAFKLLFTCWWGSKGASIVFVVYDGDDVWLNESEDTFESCLTLMFDPELGDLLIDWLF